jgi:hypothetical protein
VAQLCRTTGDAVRGVCIVCRLVALPRQRGRPKVYCAECKPKFHRKYTQFLRAQKKSAELLAELGGTMQEQELPWAKDVLRLQGRVLGPSASDLARDWFEKQAWKEH